MSTMLIHVHRHRRSHFIVGIAILKALMPQRVYLVIVNLLNIDIIDIAVSTMLKRYRVYIVIVVIISHLSNLSTFQTSQCEFDITIGEIVDIGMLNSVHLMTTLKLKHRSLVIPRLPKNTFVAQVVETNPAVQENIVYFRFFAIISFKGA